jgi:hypothetical protein
MGIQKTVGVLEALNERIKMAQEELRVVSAHNTGYSAGRVFSRIMTFACVVAAVLLMIPALVVCNSSNPDGPVGGAIFGIPSLLFWAWSLTRLARKPPENAEHIQRAEQLRRTVQRLEQEKRQLLLDQEEQIKQSQDEPEMKECPMCAELVRNRAKICKHCRHSFEEL